MNATAGSTLVGYKSELSHKLGLKLHEHSVQYAYKLVSTRRALEKH